MVKRLVGGTAILFFFFCCTQVDAARYFVSNRIGDDANSVDDAQTARKPWRTIQRAIDEAVAGDLILVLPGEYQEHPRFRTSGMPGEPITLRSAVHGQAKVLGSIGGIGVAYIRVIGMDVSHGSRATPIPQTSFDPKGLFFYYAHHVEILQNIVHDCFGGGIGLVNTDEVLVHDNLVFNNAAQFDGSHSGISVYQPLNYTGPQRSFYATSLCRNFCYSNRNSQYSDSNGQPKEITDGHGIIIDDTRATQRGAFDADLDYFRSVAESEGRSLETIALDVTSVYDREILIESNLCHSNGGSGISLFIADNVTIRSNSCVMNQTNVFDTAEINLGGAKNVLVQNNLMLSPLRVVPPKRKRNGRRNDEPVVPTDFRQAAKLSNNVVQNDEATIDWISNALYDSTTGDGLAPMHDSRSIALREPRRLAVSPVSGAVELNVRGQLRDAGSEALGMEEGDIRSAPRVQGAAIDIGAFEFDSFKRCWAGEDDWWRFFAQLALQAVRERQLPRIEFR